LLGFVHQLDDVEHSGGSSIRVLILLSDSASAQSEDMFFPPTVSADKARNSEHIRCPVLRGTSLTTSPPIHDVAVGYPPAPRSPARGRFPQPDADQHDELIAGDVGFDGRAPSRRP